jgi:hypothetical protein
MQPIIDNYASVFGWIPFFRFIFQHGKFPRVTGWRFPWESERQAIVRQNLSP